jgi:hypothetical protein
MDETKPQRLRASGLRLRWRECSHAAMNTRILEILLVGATLLFTSCGSVSSPAPSVTASPSPAPAAPAPATLAQEIIGTWILVGHLDGMSVQGANTRMKFFTGRHWLITDPNPNTHQVRYHHGGTYDLSGDELVTVVEYANANTLNRIGQIHRFKIKIEGDRLTQVALDSQFSEVWRRVK